VYIFLQVKQDFSQKKTLSIPVSCRFFIRKTDEILRTLLLMHDGISFDKIQPNKWVILGHELTENNVRKIENSVSPLAAPRSGLVLRVPHYDGQTQAPQFYHGHGQKVYHRIRTNDLSSVETKPPLDHAIPSRSPQNIGAKCPMT
jgi:hypothetical protein